MDSKNKGQVFKGLLNEFSHKAYISMSHSVYPIDRDEEEGVEVSPPLSEVSKSSSGDEIDDSNSISLKPKKGQLVEVAKLNIFVNLSPQDFLEIKKQFSYYDDGVSVTQFILIILDVLTTCVTLSEKNEDFTKALIYLYQMVDVGGRNKITFDEFSNFLVEMHDILNRDQNLFEIKLKCKQLDKVNQMLPMEKLFELAGYAGFAYLEQNLKCIRVVSPHTWEEILNVQIGATTIVAAHYLPKKNCLLLSSNDKFMNFFDMQTNKLQRRFMVPDVQTFIQSSLRKGQIYTGAVNGTIYSWDLEKIFSKEFLRAMGKHPDCFKLVLNGYPINNNEGSLTDKYSEKSLQSMLLIEALEIIATGSSDTVIRLFENKRKLSTTHKQLRGHQKAIKDLSYCAQYKYLISCSYDFDILIWNVYLDHPLARLVGHEAPLLAIVCLEQRKPHRFSLILSCDAKAVLRVWDPKTFQCLQVISVSDGVKDQRVKSIIYKKDCNLVMVGCKTLHLYEIDQSYDAAVTDDQAIVCMLYSRKYLELHLATSRHIKTWDCRQGTIKRILKDVDESGAAQITTMAIDATERRIFVGLHTGVIVVVDIFTGFRLHHIRDLTKEVCYLAYSPEYGLLVALSWDRQIRIFKDTMQPKQDQNLTLRIVKSAHVQEIVQGAFSQHLMLIATTTREGEIRIWDFEKGNFVCKLRSTGKEILALRFLDPYPLLVTSDTAGTLCINVVRPHKLESQLVVVWKNMFTIMKAAQVTCMEHLDGGGGGLRVLLGDENGDIRILDLSEVLAQLNMKPVPFDEVAQNKNMHRFFQLLFKEYENQAPDKPATEGLVNEKFARQIFSFKAHKVGIRSICVMQECQETTLITLGGDRLVKVWTLNGVLLLVLRQGSSDNTINVPLSVVCTTEVDRMMVDVRSNFETSKAYKEKLKRAKTVPFKKQQDEHNTLTHVDSVDIFKDLQEIGRYLDRKK